MFKDIDYGKILFFDIETVPQTYVFKDLDHRGKELWDRKSKYFQERDDFWPDPTA